MTQNAREEKISEMKTIVYKTLVDQSTVRLIGEREKGKLFSKLRFIRSNKEGIQLESLTKFYDPFLTVNGRYFIDYYRRRIYKLDVEGDVSELLIFNRTLQPITSKLAKMQGKARVVEVEAEQRIIKENSTFIILDKKGLEVELENFPTAPAEENLLKVLSEAGDRFLVLRFHPIKP